MCCLVSQAVAATFMIKQLLAFFNKLDQESSQGLLMQLEDPNSVKPVSNVRDAQHSHKANTAAPFNAVCTCASFFPLAHVDACMLLM